MWNLLGVLCGTAALAWLLFVRRSSACKILSASRWMVFSWGILLLVHCFSPITFYSLSVSWRVWIYSAAWVGTFAFADNVKFTFGITADSEIVPQKTVGYSTTSVRVCTLLAVLGGILLVYVNRDTLIASNANSVVAELRNSQLGGDDSSLLKTVATLLACGGLPVALLELCHAIRNQANISVRAGLGLLSYLVVTMSIGGRPGFVLATLSVFIAALSSVLLTGSGFAKFRKILVAGCLLAVISIGYIMFVVSTRTIGFTGGMDNKIELVNGLIATDLDPTFRESLRPLGSIGDTVIESFYYFGTQFEGLDYSLRHFGGPFGSGFTELPYLTRRVESTLGVAIIDPVFEAHNHMYEEINIFPHFFETAAESTYLDFGAVLSLPVVFLCGTLCRKARIRALHSGEATDIALQAILCSGAAWTIIISPFEEESWAFPLIWFLCIYAAVRILAIFSQHKRAPSEA